MRRGKNLVSRPTPKLRFADRHRAICDTRVAHLYLHVAIQFYFLPKYTEVPLKAQHENNA